jgi:uncharacterized protein
MAASDDLAAKRDALSGIIRDLGDAAIAYSGGVDSTLLVAVAVAVLPRDRVLALTARSQLTVEDEIRRAEAIARSLGARHRVVEVDALGDPKVAANPPDRCYFCKHLIFGTLREHADAEGLDHLLHGANLDDTGDFRPGMRAADELGARAPLLQAGFTKANVRELARELGLPNWDLPSSACLASRVPYHQPLSTPVLARIEAAESAVRELTSERHLRVRDHFPVALIEVAAAHLGNLVEPAIRERLVARLKALGYRYVTLDLTGFRSGSLNEVMIGGIEADDRM